MALCPTCQTFRGPWDETCAKCGFSYKGLDAQKQAAGAKAADVAAGCPACGAPRREGEESCLGCGVVYAKWKPREPRPAAASVAAASSTPLLGDNAHKERPGCLTIMMVGTILINGAAAVLLPVLNVPGISLGPAIVSCVVTALCAVWVLRWKRWSVYGIAIIQVLSIASLAFSSTPLAMVQPVLVLALFYHFVGPIWHQFD